MQFAVLRAPQKQLVSVLVPSPQLLSQLVMGALKPFIVSV